MDATYGAGKVGHVATLSWCGACSSVSGVDVRVDVRYDVRVDVRDDVRDGVRDDVIMDKVPSSLCARRHERHVSDVLWGGVVSNMRGGCDQMSGQVTTSRHTLCLIFPTLQSCVCSFYARKSAAHIKDLRIHLY